MGGRRAAAYLALALLAGCRTPRTAEPPPTPATDERAAAVTVQFDNAPALTVEVASTPAERQRGLMNRTAVPPGTGMLFVFPASESGGFWMKNTLVPLSIAYLDGDRVVSTAEMVPCPPDTDRCPSYAAASPYTAAVEATAGFFPLHGIRAGSRMRISGPTPAPR